MKTLLKTLGTTVFFLMISCAPLLAAKNEYAENFSNWWLDGLFWIVLVVGLSITAAFVAKRNFSGTLITLAVTGLLCVIINDPNILVRFGNTLKTVIGL